MENTDFLITHKDFEISISISHGDIIDLDYNKFMKIISIEQKELLSNYTDELWSTYKLYDSDDIRCGILNCLLICALTHNIEKKKIKNLNKKDLYFLQADNGLIKIGISNDVDRRVVELENILKTNINILKVLQNKGSYENHLHKIYSDDNIIYKKQTEWFHPTHKLINFISNVNEKNIDYYGK